MKTLNGGLFIVIAFFILWIGVTGRFPRLIEAIGLVRGKAPESPSKSDGIKSNTGTVPPAKLDVLHAPVLDVWRDALKSIGAAAQTNPMDIGVGP